MKHTQEHRSRQLDGSCRSALVRPLPEQPHLNWPEKFDRGRVQTPLGCSKCSTQPKNPQDYGTDGNSYDSMLLKYDTKPSCYRSATSSSLEMNMWVGI